MKTPLQNAKAKLQIAKKELGMDDHSYRQVLIRNGAPATDPSSKHMTLAQIDAALKELRKLGWKPKRSAAAKGKQSPASRQKGAGNHTRVDKLRAIWIGMARAGFISDGSETALLNWVRSQIKGDAIDALEWLENTNHANRVLEQLKQWKQRVETKALNEDLVLIRAAIPALEHQGQSVTESEAAQILLDHHVITWHGLLADLGLQPSEHYASNRQQLRPLTMILGNSGETACK